MVVASLIRSGTESVEPIEVQLAEKTRLFRHDKVTWQYNFGKLLLFMDLEGTTMGHPTNNLPVTIVLDLSKRFMQLQWKCCIGRSRGGRRAVVAY